MPSKCISVGLLTDYRLNFYELLLIQPGHFKRKLYMSIESLELKRQ